MADGMSDGGTFSLRSAGTGLFIDGVGDTVALLLLVGAALLAVGHTAPPVLHGLAFLAVAHLADLIVDGGALLVLNIATLILIHCGASGSS